MCQVYAVNVSPLSAKRANLRQAPDALSACLYSPTRKATRPAAGKGRRGVHWIEQEAKRGKEEERVIYENEADEEKEEEEVHKRQAYTRARHSCRQVQLSLAFTSLVAI